KPKPHAQAETPQASRGLRGTRRKARPRCAKTQCDLRRRARERWGLRASQQSFRTLRLLLFFCAAVFWPPCTESRPAQAPRASEVALLSMLKAEPSYC